MKKGSFLKKMACATALLLSTSSVALATNTEDFTGIAVFGDSFAYGGTWTQNLTEQLGFTFKNNDTNFAIGGQGSGYIIGGTFDHIGRPRTTTFSSQLDTYLTSKGKFGTNDIVIYNPLASEIAMYETLSSGFTGKIMDDFDQIVTSGLAINRDNAKTKVLEGTLSMDSSNFPNLFSFLKLTEDNTQAFMQKAIDNGANYILVSNHFNEEFKQSGGFIYADTVLQQQMKAMGIPGDYMDIPGSIELGGMVSRKIAKAQIRGAQKTGANIIVWDNYNLFQELFDDPSKYLTAVDRALGTDVMVNGKSGILAGEHPTTPVHKIINQFVFSVFTSPTLVSTLREIPLASAMKTANLNQTLAQDFALTRQLQSDIAGSSDSDSDRKFAVQVFGDFGKSKTGKFSKKDLGFTDDSSWDFGVGLNYKATDNFVVGANVEYSETKTKFEADRGNSKIKEKAVSLHGIYSFEQPVFVYASAGYGKLDYDITRSIKLGLATRKEKGTPSGDHFFGTLGTGYRFDVAKNVSITPFVAGHYQSISMDSYAEKGLNKVSTAMGFNVPKRESIMAEVGVTFAGKVEAAEHVALTPSLTVSYLHDWRNPLTQNIKFRNIKNMDELEINYGHVPGYNVQKDTMKVQGSLLTEIDNKYQVGVNASCRPTGRVKSWSVGIKSAIKL